MDVDDDNAAATGVDEDDAVTVAVLMIMDVEESYDAMMMATDDN